MQPRPTAAVSQLTEQAVALLRSSAGWQRWLTVRAQVGVLVRTLSPAANRADRATTQPVEAAAATVGDRCEPGRLPLVALSRWP